MFLVIVHDALRQLEPVFNRPVDTGGQKNVRAAELPAEQETVISDHRRDRLELIHEVLLGSLARGRRLTIEARKCRMATDHVKRVRIELRHDEKAPLVQLGPRLRAPGHVDARRWLERLADILDNRGALRDYHVAMPEHWHLVPWIDLQEFIGVRLATTWMNRAEPVIESHLHQH